MSALDDRLVGVVRGSPWLMRALRAAREVDPPDWVIGAGAVRDLVWGQLHGICHPPAPRDIDLAFFDPTALEEAREAGVACALAERAPELSWDVKNQAAIHLWYPEVFGVEVEPVASLADAVGTWPETASCVGVRLRSGDRFEVVAPFGLEDLFGMVWRRNPRRVTVAEYQQRLARKRVAERWPRARIVN